MQTPSAWSLVLVRLFIATGAALTAGVIFGYPELWLIGVLAAYLGWNLYHAFLLDRWLNFRRGKRPRSAPGVWGRVYTGIHRLATRGRERKRRLKQVLKEFRKATGAMPDASVVLNRHNEIVWLNDVATNYLGISKADRGRRVDYFLRDPDFVEYLRHENFDRPLPLVSPVNGGRTLSVRIIAYGQDQRLLLAKDVTRERRLEKIRRDFVGNASHELRSPLTVVSGYLDSLSSDPELPEGWREPVREMMNQSARMKSIIDDLLTLSRLEASQAPAGDEPVDVGGLTALIRKDVLAARSPCAAIDLETDSDVRILGAESELYSAFWNLVQNAAKYTPADGRILIRWFADDSGGYLSVSDSGVGIPEEAIPRLTERFYRVDKGRDRIKGGTGLGLAIVKHVLQRHGATLEIESEVGRGSTFTCRFPVTRLAHDDRRVPATREAG
jgi:two-component system phosphate regulon sensor histidine kinase PhoR